MRIGPGPVNVFRELPRSGAEPRSDAAERPDGSGRSPFLQRLGEAVKDVNSLQQEAATQQTRLATGEAQSVEDVVIAMEKADLALQLTVQVTQKAVEAYREISRMQV
jgi:flagellar hook-basal body complex protein FliE